MTTLLQVSDPHFGTEVPAVVEALRALVRAEPPEILVLSGDITQRARRSQFESARRFVDSLAIPRRLVIPGNHDIPLFDLFARVSSPYGRYARSFGHDLAPTIDCPDMLVIGVNTTTPWRHTDGEVKAPAIARVVDLLRRATARQLRVVVTHQPAVVVREQDRRNILHGQEEAIRAWSEAGADIVMGGHIHLPYVCPIHEQDEALPRRMWGVNAGTAVSRRIRHEAGNSVNLVRSDGTSGLAACAIERWDFEREAGAFRRVAVHELSPER